MINLDITGYFFAHVAAFGATFDELVALYLPLIVPAFYRFQNAYRSWQTEVGHFLFYRGSL